MNLFDLVAGAILLISALIGFSRGAILELVTLLAFTVAAALSIFLLPYTAPLARASVQPAWAANAVAVGAAFLIAYIGFRVLGGGLSRAVRAQATLGSVDRSIGLAFGVLRALVILGATYLVVSATPIGHPPDVMQQAALFPLARQSGLLLAQVAPNGLSELSGIGSSLRAHLSGQEPASPGGPVDAGQAYGPMPGGDTSSTSAPERTLQIDNGQPVRHHRHHQSTE